MLFIFCISCLVAGAHVGGTESTSGGVDGSLPVAGASIGASGWLSPHLAELHRASAWSRSGSDGAQPADDIVTSCEAYIDVFSEAAANYTHCALAYARPLRFCEHCYTEYLFAKSVYKVIMSGEVLVDHGFLCKDLILNSDRIQIVVRVNDFITGLWSDCHCDNCFKYCESENGTVRAKLSNDTLEFLSLANETHACFNNYSADCGPFASFTNETNCTVICDNCYDIYKKMNDFYVKIAQHATDGLCMDIVDIMNSTRQLWSGTFSCALTPGNMLPVLVVSSFFAMLPVIFYVSNRIHGARKERHLMRQRRLRLPSTSGNGQQASSTRDDPSSDDDPIRINRTENSLHQES